jgi:hypothetical protein
MEINKDFYFNERSLKNSEKKSQIVLVNTTQPIEPYLYGLSNRNNKRYTKIPTFTIDREGIIYQHFDPLNSSKILNYPTIDNQAITIALENVGWLNFHEKYTDWSGNTYNDEVIEKLWRNKKYWAKYTEKQFLSLIELIDYLCNEYNIQKEFIGNNVTTHKPHNFNGILNRSNFSKNHYDLTPAFCFDKLTEKINELKND